MSSAVLTKSIYPFPRRSPECALAMLEDTRAEATAEVEEAMDILEEGPEGLYASL